MRRASFHNQQKRPAETHSPPVLLCYYYVFMAGSKAVIIFQVQTGCKTRDCSSKTIEKSRENADCSRTAVADKKNLLRFHAGHYTKTSSSRATRETCRPLSIPFYRHMLQKRIIPFLQLINHASSRATAKRNGDRRQTIGRSRSPRGPPTFQNPLTARAAKNNRGPFPSVLRG